jgi:hypothetical protein
VSSSLSPDRERRERQTKRPNVQRRRRRCQAYLLCACVANGGAAAAIDELLAMQRLDPASYASVVPDDWPLSAETLRRYWKDIPLATRNLAAMEFRPGPSWQAWLTYVL